MTEETKEVQNEEIKIRRCDPRDHFIRDWFDLGEGDDFFVTIADMKKYYWGEGQYLDQIKVFASYSEEDVRLDISRLPGITEGVKNITINNKRKSIRVWFGIRRKINV